jgi:hypothetical protein
MDNQDHIRNLQESGMQLGMLALSLEDFSIQIIRHVLRGGVLDDEAFSEIKATAIRNLKNSAATGLSIEREAETFRKALEDFDKLMDDAILKGRS